MAPPRVRKGELFDSAYGTAADFPAPPPAAGKPPAPPVPPGPPARPPQDSSLDITIEDEVVSVAVDSAPLRAKILSALGSQSFVVAGPDVVGGAAVVVADAAGDPARRMGELRRVARPDAAVILVLSSTSAADVARALQAGAFACLLPPLVPEELLKFVGSALDSRAAKVQAADLSRKLDLETHLASIGRMTAGLSHEIGSPLGAAVVSMETVQSEVARVLKEKGVSLDALPNLKGAMEDTIASHARLRALLDTMRALVRKERTNLGRVDVTALMQSVRGWLADELQGVQVETIGSPLFARADADMLGQILHNLVANAAHAARALPSPRIRLHVYESEGRVIASVRDNGPGIPPEIHDRIFEPFFTTRRGVGGTGLGLALCLEYATQMDAELSFWSLPGRGTCFRVSLRRG